MGTNYYLWKHSHCPHCGHIPDDIHLGKDSGGWSFLVQGYADGELPFGLTNPINSHRDMLKVVADMLTRGWGIKDEYGTSLSEYEFKQMVDATKKGSSHHDALKRDGHDMDGQMKDKDGWSITYREFC